MSSINSSDSDSSDSGDKRVRFSYKRQRHYKPVAPGFKCEDCDTKCHPSSQTSITHSDDFPQSAIVNKRYICICHCECENITPSQKCDFCIKNCNSSDPPRVSIKMKGTGWACVCECNCITDVPGAKDKCGYCFRYCK